MIENGHIMPPFDFVIFLFELLPQVILSKFFLNKIHSFGIIHCRVIRFNGVSAVSLKKVGVNAVIFATYPIITSIFYSKPKIKHILPNVKVNPIFNSLIIVVFVKVPSKDISLSLNRIRITLPASIQRVTCDFYF